MVDIIIKTIKKVGRKTINLVDFVRHFLFGKLECPVCGNRIIKYYHFNSSYLDEFFRYRFIHPITAFETFNAIGYSCPICRGNDSTRLYALYLKEKLGKSKTELSILDIAPTPILAEYVKKFDKTKYRSADLYMEDVDDKVDLTDMSIYKDNAFDMIICTHVLEHIKDDWKAMRELFRVLKPGGEAMIQVPIVSTLEEDYENDAVKTEADHWRHYGEPTHVRAYSKKGFSGKLESARFKVNQLGIGYFGKETFLNNSIGETAVLYISKK